MEIAQYVLSHKFYLLHGCSSPSCVSVYDKKQCCVIHRLFRQFEWNRCLQ